MVTEPPFDTALRTAPVLQRMPIWPERVLDLAFTTWWGRVEVSPSGLATLAVINPRAVSLSDAQKVAGRIWADRHPLRYYSLLAALVAGAAAAIAGGITLIREVGGWATLIAAIVILLGLLLLPPVGQQLMHRRRLPDGTYIEAKIDEAMWTTVRYLNSYRRGPDDQRDAVRMLLHTMMQSTVSSEQSPLVVDAFEEIASTTHHWSELPTHDLAHLCARLQDALNAQRSA